MLLSAVESKVQSAAHHSRRTPTCPPPDIIHTFHHPPTVPCPGMKSVCGEGVHTFRSCRNSQEEDGAALKRVAHFICGIFLSLMSHVVLRDVQLLPQNTRGYQSRQI